MESMKCITHIGDTASLVEISCEEAQCEIFQTDKPDDSILAVFDKASQSKLNLEKLTMLCLWTSRS